MVLLLGKYFFGFSISGKVSFQVVKIYTASLILACGSAKSTL